MVAKPEVVDPLIAQNATREATTPPVSSRNVSASDLSTQDGNLDPLGLGTSHRGHVAQKWPLASISRKGEIVKLKGVTSWPDFLINMPGAVQSSSLYLYVASTFIPSARQNLLRAPHHLSTSVVLFLTIWSELYYSSAFTQHITYAFNWEHCSAL